MFTCSLYGAGSYQGDWITVNLIVVLLGFAATALVYQLSRLFPSRASALISSMTKAEFFQLSLSIIIILVLITMSAMICSATASFTKQLTGSSQTPFDYAEYYIGNLSLNTGLRLLTYLYTYSVAYMMDAQILSKASEWMKYSGIAPGTKNLPVGITITGEFELGAAYSILASFYVSLFATLIITAIGMLFIQFLVLPIIQSVAFAVLLPVALILRSIAYAGGRRDSLRHAANAFLALAIALYLVYPATIALDGYVTSWIYSQNNPLYQYLSPTLSVYNIPPTLFSAAEDSASGQYTNIFLLSPGSGVASIISQFANYGVSSLWPFSVPSQAMTIVADGSQFLFIAIILFAFNSAITLAFAQSLAAALNMGVTGPVPFWSSL